MLSALLLVVGLQVQAAVPEYDPQAAALAVTGHFDPHGPPEARVLLVNFDEAGVPDHVSRDEILTAVVKQSFPDTCFKFPYPLINKIPDQNVVEVRTFAVRIGELCAQRMAEPIPFRINLGRFKPGQVTVRFVRPSNQPEEHTVRID